MIKNITLFLAMILCTIVCAQGPEANCQDAPSFEFEGTDISFNMLISDVLIDPDECQGLVYHKHRSDITLDPIEYDDKYIVFYDTGGGSGSRMLGVDKESSEVLWDHSASFMTDTQQRAIEYKARRILDDGNLEIKTSRSHLTWDMYNIPENFFFGLHGRRIIDPETGAIISDYWVGDTVDVAGLNWPSYPYTSIIATNQEYNYVEERGLYLHDASFVPGIKDSFTIQLHPKYTDSISLLPVDTNLVEGRPPQVFLSHVDEAGNKGSYYRKFGPIKTLDGGRMYIYRYRLGNKAITSIFKYDERGYFMGDTPINDYIHNQQSHSIIVSKIKAQKDRIILPVLAWDYDTEEKLRTYTYIVLDREGNKIHGRESLIFDDLTASRGVTTYLEKRKSYLHIFRPRENHNVYFYEEYEDGSYRKAGELKSTGDPEFVPHPQNLWSMDNGDVFIHMDMVLDSIDPRGVGGRYYQSGWSSMLKIDADALGLKTSTTDVTSTSSIALYPNPTADKVHFQTEDALHLEVYDVTGRRLDSETIEAGTSYDLSGHPEGMYFFHMRDDKGRLLGVEKVVRL